MRNWLREDDDRGSELRWNTYWKQGSEEGYNEAAPCPMAELPIRKETLIRMLKHFFPFCLALLAAVSLSPASADPAARNVILLIGDGMGPNQVISAERSPGREGKLVMQTLPVHTAIATRSASSEVTDSAAAATALASGVKTHNKVVGMDTEGRPVRTILEAARDAGMSVGIVTTTQLTNATPACFASHVKDRSQETEIAEQLISSGATVLMGGGLEFFVPASHGDSQRKDDLDLLARARAKGYVVALNPEQFAAAPDQQILALLNLGGLTTAPPEPSLKEMTSKAIRVLSKSEKPFMLVVEGGQIDWRCHSNDLEGSIRQTLLFDEAIAAAWQFAKEDGETLVVVTADHETGGLEPGEGGKGWKFSRTGHSSTPVDLWAGGPGSDMFGAAADNTDNAKLIARILNLQIGGAFTRPWAVGPSASVK